MDVVEEEGYVAEVAGERVVVIVERARAETCEHCGLCFRRPDGRYQIEAVTKTPVKQADRVVVRIEQPGALTLSALVFLVPVTALVVGMVLGRYLTRDPRLVEWRDLVQAVLGLGGAGAAFFGLYFYDRSLRARRAESPPRIVRVVERGTDKPDEGSTP